MALPQKSGMALGSILTRTSILLAISSGNSRPLFEPGKIRYRRKRLDQQRPET